MQSSVFTVQRTKFSVYWWLKFILNVQVGKLLQPAKTGIFFVGALLVCSVQQHDLVIWDSGACICPNVHQRTLMCPFYAQYAIQITLVPCVPLAKMQRNKRIFLHCFSKYSQKSCQSQDPHVPILCLNPPSRIWGYIHASSQFQMTVVVKKSCGCVNVAMSASFCSLGHECQSLTVP